MFKQKLKLVDKLGIYNSTDPINECEDEIDIDDLDQDEFCQELNTQSKESGITDFTGATRHLRLPFNVSDQLDIKTNIKLFQLKGKLKGSARARTIDAQRRLAKKAAQLTEAEA